MDARTHVGQDPASLRAHLPLAHPTDPSNLMRHQAHPLCEPIDQLRSLFRPARVIFSIPDRAGKEFTHIGFSLVRRDPIVIGSVCLDRIKGRGEIFPIFFVRRLLRARSRRYCSLGSISRSDPVFRPHIRRRTCRCGRSTVLPLLSMMSIHLSDHPRVLG